MDNLQQLPLAVLGVIADTHVPDRLAGLHPALLPTLRAAGVQQILHAGDISTPSVLKELSQVAPVTAVRGNRDLIFFPALPWVQRLEVAGVKIALMHGHLSWSNYLRDKLHYFAVGYHLERYESKILQVWPEADVCIFGHTHRREVIWVGQRLLLNPGPAGIGIHKTSPSLAILRIYPEKQVEVEVIVLDGAHLNGRRWENG